MEKLESELITEHQNGVKEATNEIFARNEKFISFIYDRHFKNCGCPREDMLQEGCMGLFEAVKRFKPEYGDRFTSYKMIWIKKKMYYFRKKYFKGPQTIELDDSHLQLPWTPTSETKMREALFELDNLVKCGKISKKDSESLLQKIAKGKKINKKERIK